MGIPLLLTVSVELSWYNQEVSWVWFVLTVVAFGAPQTSNVLEVGLLLLVLGVRASLIASALPQLSVSALNLGPPTIVECWCGGILCCSLPASFFGCPIQLILGREAFLICLHILPVATKFSLISGVGSRMISGKIQELICFFCLSSRKSSSSLSKCNLSLPVPCRQESLLPFASQEKRKQGTRTS